jgi:hypothetical protein
MVTPSGAGLERLGNAEHPAVDIHMPTLTEACLRMLLGTLREEA